MDRLIPKGAQVKDLTIYDSDLGAEAARFGQKRKILTFKLVSERQLRMLDALAAQIPWPRRDSYERFCYKHFNAPRPRNPREVDRLAAILRSMIERQVLAYYRKLLEGPRLSVERLREIAISHLAKPESIEYLRSCSWDRLAIGLYAQGARLCSGCLEAKPLSDFASVAAAKCGACRAAARQKTIRSWFANNKRRRADYMWRYRSGKAAHLFPGTRDGAREQENQGPRPDDQVIPGRRVW